MTAIEIRTAEKTLRSRPVYIDGIMQPTLHELTAPCDVEVNGVFLLLPAGSVICLTSGGSTGAAGRLWHDVDFVGYDGKTWRATSGTSVRVVV